MAGFEFALARGRYQGRLPTECFLADAPDWIKYADDNVLFPSGDLHLTVDNGYKCIKFSNYHHFLESVRVFWNQYGGIQAEGLEQVGLRVIVMPYTPAAEAHRLHTLVVHPDLLPNSFAETVANPMPVNVGVPQIQIDEEEEEGPELALWNEREGVVHLQDLHADVRFSVTNYGLLWAKAEKFCISTFTNDALEDLVARLTLCDHHLHQPTAALLAALDDDLLEARSHLLFAMYNNEMNPHDAIHLLFPEMHNHVYQGCVHCNPNIEEDARVDPPDTMTRLYEALVDIGLEDYDGNLSVDQARVKLMSAEGLVEGYRSEHNVMQSFNVAKEHFRQAMLPLLNELNVVRHRVSVMGVPFYLDDE